MKRLYILLLAVLPILFACTRKEQEVRVESVTLNQTSVELQIGKTLQLDATVSPSTATNPDVSWSSSNASVASVSKSGLVTAVKEGSAKIIAAADGKKAECTVTVRKDAITVSEVKLNKTELTLKAGEDETLTATVLPDNATDKKVTWESSDKSIATVSSSGKVKAVFTGHHHVGYRAVHNGIFYYTLRAISQDAYPENNSYAEVTMYDSGRIVVKGFVKAASAMYTSP